MFNIFDQPWTLLITAAVVFIILSLVGKFVTLKPRRLPIGLALLITVAGFALDFFIVTDLEKIHTAITTVVKAVEEENAAAIEPLISGSYRDSFHRDKKSLMRSCDHHLSEPLLTKAIKTVISVDISDETATSVFTVRLVFDKRSQYADFVPLMLMKIKIDLRKENTGKWLITRGELLELNGQPANWNNINP